MAKNKIIEHTLYQTAYQRLIDCHQGPKDGLPFAHVKVLGPSGSGKSTLLRDYEARHPRYDETDRTIVPVLYAKVPPRPTIANVAGALLRAMGCPLWKKGDAEDRTDHLLTLLSECRTELVLVDEAQHLVDRGRTKTHALVADWIKVTSDDSEIPWVIAGLPRTQLLDAANDQFGRRFGSEVTLDRLDPFDGDAVRVIGGIIVAQTAEFRVVVAPSIDTTDLASRVGFASDGLIGYMTKLLAETARTQKREKLRHCDLAVFAQAFRDAIWADAPDDRNPFVGPPGKLRTRLTGVNEPFSPENDALGEA